MSTPLLETTMLESISVQPNAITFTALKIADGQLKHILALYVTNKLDVNRVKAIQLTDSRKAQEEFKLQSWWIRVENSMFIIWQA